MHRFDENGTAPLYIKVKPQIFNNHVEFNISESHHLSLEKYYLEYIGIITPNELCQSGIAFRDKTKGTFSLDGLIVWEYQPKLPKEKIGVLTNLIYGFKGKNKKLQKNTLYVVEIGIKKIDEHQYLRTGYGTTYFYINSKEDVIIAKTSKERNTMCKKFSRQVYNW